MYTTTTNSFDQTVIIKTDGDTASSFLEDPNNKDYQEYLEWLAEGNTPEGTE